MTKAELVKKIACYESITKKEAKRRLEAILDEIERALDTEGNLTLKGFGIFTVRNRKERMGKNPKTGAPAVIKARRKVTFKTGKRFSSFLNKE